jgi:predicted transcriptional regulator
MKKSELFGLVESLPDDFEIEELMYRLYIKAKVEEAEAAILAGDVMPHEEVEKLFDHWLA